MREVLSMIRVRRRERAAVRRGVLLLPPLLLLPAAAAAVGAPATDPRQAAPGDAIARGAVVYEQTCVACHGADGAGLSPGTPDFTDPKGPLVQDDAVLFDHIKNGFQSPGSMMAMPPKGGNPSLSDDDIRAVIAYLRATFGRAEEK
ncbi:MAG: hypothetical protein KatS3mg119_1657 [Rhodothalassiaceae bacterium]|nr:MAG: hypothetical protein KatS3mg119_1657 [Rhodothalassiaceae bacterium]